MAEKSNYRRLTELMLKLFSCNAVKFGSFTLKSGIQSPVYFDLRVIVSYPELMRGVSEMLWEVATRAGLKFDCICGVPYTALPLASVMSVDHNMPMLIRRKEAKDYGTKKMVEGHFTEGDTCLIIEDVVTSGTSVLETVQTLNQVGLVVTDAIVLLDRSQGGRDNLHSHKVNLHSVCSLPVMTEILSEAGKLDATMVEQVMTFIAENSQVSASVPSPPASIPPPKHTKMLSYGQRAALCEHPVSKRLFDIMQRKRTNLCVSADVTNCAELLRVASSVGPHICVLKTHVDMLTDFSEKFLEDLQAAARLHDFVIFEDRKFSDIGHTVLSQYEGGMYRISGWADIVNAHAVSGPGVVTALKQVGMAANRACLLIAEMSSEGSLAHGDYTKAVVAMAEANDDFVIGYICQSKLSDNPCFLHMSPGVHLAAKGAGDDLGQRYNDPEEMIGTRGVDVLIVGRGILQAADVAKAAESYQHAGYAAYQAALKATMPHSDR